MTLQGLNGANRFTEALGLGVRRQFGPGGIFDTRTERGSATAYSIALFLVLIAALARWGLGLLSPLLLPFTAFYPAVLFASYIGGFRVGIFAAILGALIGWWGFLPPQFAFFPLDPDGWVYILTYAGVCALVIWGAGSSATSRKPPTSSLRAFKTKKIFADSHWKN